MDPGFMGSNRPGDKCSGYWEIGFSHKIKKHRCHLPVNDWNLNAQLLKFSIVAHYRIENLQNCDRITTNN
jgi:hypothetical protein